MRPLLLSLLLAAPAGAQSLRREPPHLSGASAASASGCQQLDPEIVGGAQAYASGLSSGRCYASIGPVNTSGMVYRAYVVFSDGMLMVFSSYGPGSDVKRLTSARVFWFFPRSGPLSLDADAKAGRLSVVMADGATLGFDPATAQLGSVDRGQVLVTKRVDPADRGGVEFPSYAGLVLDTGFRQGELPQGLPAAESTFRSANGQLCRVMNSEIFSYANGESAFKFTDAQLSAFLKTRCPGLTPGF